MNIILFCTLRYNSRDKSALICINLRLINWPNIDIVPREENNQENNQENSRIKYKSYKEEYEDTWLPMGLKMGLSIWEVGKLNPHKMRILERNYLENERKKDEEMWLLGRYFMHSISAALNSDVQYFEKPLFADKYDEMLLTPEELEKKRIDEMLRAEENWQNVGRESGLDDI